MTFEKLTIELEEIYSTLEFEENGGIHITGTDWYSDGLKVEFTIKTGIEGQNQLWEIQIKGVRDELIKSDPANKLELFEEHPLLWTYNQQQTSLYFGCPTTRPYELFANIYARHEHVTNRKVPFNKYFDRGISVMDLCKSPSGLFASGPFKLLEGYMEVLKNHGMNPTIVGGHNPKRWLNGHQIDETEIVKVLVIGDSYVVGKTFDFNRV